MQNDLFNAPLERAPVMVALGGGVDSVSMIIEMHARGEPIDMVLMAQTRSENPKTDEYMVMFEKWMADRNIPFQNVINKVSNYKHWPRYEGLFENCVTNATLPSITFGYSSCSQKWKIAPQNKFVDTWELGQRAIRQGLKIIKCIGYDAGKHDSRRYAEREGYVDEIYEYRYPLREWGWTREQCIERIEREGIAVPPKSACFMCAATKPHELHDFPKTILRRIVLIEARAHPRLRNVDGLWRKPVKGVRGGTPRPGSMTQYIREQGLLPEVEIDLIWNEAPKALISWQESVANTPIDERPAMASWIEFFDKHHELFEGDGAVPLYPSAMSEGLKLAA